MSRVVVVVSVDWEGRSLLPENLELMAEFRRKHPDVPIQHFLNPAYYTRPGIDARQTTDAIRAALLPEDDHGLHIHAWQSLLDASGVTAENPPSFITAKGPVLRRADDWDFYPAEAGYGTPIEHFDVTELGKVIATSSQILVKQGFDRPTSFRAGGWMSGPKVQEALVKNGFHVDCSAVDVGPVARRFGDIPHCEWLKNLWPTINDTSQPFQIATPSGPLWEVPNNANLADYLSADEIVEIFRRNVSQWESSKGNPCFVSTGFHQETARIFLERLDQAITVIKDLSREQGWPLHFSAKPQEFLHARIAANTRST